MGRVLRRIIKPCFVLIFGGTLTFLILSNNPFVNNEEKIIKVQHKDKVLERLNREVTIENRDRIARVTRVCKKYSMGRFKTASAEVEFKEAPAPQYSIFYIDSKHNISYCPIYKSGSTSWIYNLCLLNGVSEKELTSGKEQISVIARRIMPELEYPEAEKLLERTAKVLIVRHPFERLLSAYRDKLENSVAGREHGSLHFYKKYGRAIVKKYRDKERAPPGKDEVIRTPGQPGPTGLEPTWREFVEYLVDTDLASYADDHWTPYYLYCTPCLINYDVIAKVESMSRDQAFAIHQLGLDGLIRPRWRHGSGSSPGAAAVYFKQLTKDHVRKLHDKFRVDLELFGYSAEAYYDLATGAP